jgi:hypothetical protein
MNSKKAILVIMLIMASLLTAGCGRDDETLEPAPINTNPVIFDDNFSSNLDYAAFLNSKYDALEMDTEVKYNGTTSLKLIVPGPDDEGWFAGGVFFDATGRDLTGYDALTFYARCDKASATINEAGIGNDNSGESIYTATTFSIAISNSWKKFYIPIPDPAKLSLENGMFFFSEGHEDNAGYTIWFDDIIFEKTGLFNDPRPSLEVTEFSSFLGTSVPIPGTQVIYDLEGSDIVIHAMPAYFSFISSNEEVATVSLGKVSALTAGNSNLTAMLGTTSAEGEIAYTAMPAPVVPAPDPTEPEGDVISIFSDAYADWPVDTYSPDWDRADLASFSIGDDEMLLYTNVNTYAGIIFEQNVIDARSMEYLHIDVWVPANVTSIGIKLIDYGADGEYGGAPDSEKELFFSAGSTPALTPGTWSSLDIPMADYTVPGGLASTEHLAQLYLTGANITIFADNIYFYRLPATR